MTAKSWYNTTL